MPFSITPSAGSFVSSARFPISTGLMTLPAPVWSGTASPSGDVLVNEARWYRQGAEVKLVIAYEMTTDGTGINGITFSNVTLPFEPLRLTGQSTSPASNRPRGAVISSGTTANGTINSQSGGSLVQSGSNYSINARWSGANSVVRITVIYFTNQ